MNPLSRILFEYIFRIRSQNSDKEYLMSSDFSVKMLDFPDFVAFMSIFHPHTPLTAKLECKILGIVLFNILVLFEVIVYDQGKGHIDSSVLSHLIREVSSKLEVEQEDFLIESMLNYFGDEQSGLVERERFINVLVLV